LAEHLRTGQRRRDRALTAALLHRQQSLARHAHALELLGPRQTLARGFTITMDTERRPLTSAALAATQKAITTLFADGELTSRPSA
jgi:exodeoxyribonuclease VII large subunit